MWIVLHIFDERFHPVEEFTYTCFVCSPESFPGRPDFKILWPGSCGLPEQIQAEVERDIQPTLRAIHPSVLRCYCITRDIDVVLRRTRDVVAEADSPRHVAR